MARSTRTTIVLSALLLTPLAASLAYFHFVDGATDAAPPELATDRVSSPAPVTSAAPVAQPVVPVVPVVPAVPTVPVVPAVTVEDPVAEPVTDAIAAPETADGPKIAGPAAMLLHEGRLVLVTHPELAWSSDPQTLTLIDDGYTVRRAVLPQQLPASVQSVVGGRYTLYSADGSACVAEATKLSFFGQEQSQGLAEEGKTRPSRAVAQEMAGKLGDSGYIVEAALKAPAGCSGLLARAAELPAPSFFVHQAGDPSLRERVKALFAARPAVVELQREYATYLAEMFEETPHDEPTWEVILEQSFSFARWDELGGSRSFITAQMSRDDECGGFFASAAVVFELAGEALTLHTDQGFMNPSALLDIDRDGKLEAITDGGKRLETRGSGSLARTYSFMNTYCPC